MIVNHSRQRAAIQFVQLELFYSTIFYRIPLSVVMSSASTTGTTTITASSHPPSSIVVRPSQPLLEQARAFCHLAHLLSLATSSLS